MRYYETASASIQYAENALMLENLVQVQDLQARNSILVAKYLSGVWVVRN